MTGMMIIAVGVILIIMAVLLRQKQVAAILAARQKEVISVGDLTRWWKLHLSCMGGFLVIVGLASFGFRQQSPWIFVAAACFIVVIFGSMALMGVKLLEKTSVSQEK